ncbi:hypothetical protein V1525DRAFT_413104 [Lipomyces kononenkoae]|uniref:Uncharacterized protein n=1 Tax=Lipomyces kononenkoae TaxID=34357 RepID=A0ACC3SS24_LIPKO
MICQVIIAKQSYAESHASDNYLILIIRRKLGQISKLALHRTEEYSTSNETDQGRGGTSGFLGSRPEQFAFGSLCYLINYGFEVYGDRYRGS